MPPSDPFTRPDDRPLDEAASWMARAHDAMGAAGGQEFSAWLDQSSDNRRAHHEVARAWNAVGDIGSAPEMLALRRAALDNASRAARRRWRRRPGAQLVGRWMAAAAMLLLVIAAAGAFVWSRPPLPEVYETALGERRIVTLADESKVSLDEASRVSVIYSRRFRDLKLEKGQAEFEVASDPLRPFSVSAGDRRVVATGTVFNVDLLQDRLIVTLVRGSVVVAPEAERMESGPVIPLKPAERLVVQRATGSTVKSTVDPADAEAWKLGKLVFDGEPLEQAVARVNRYARRRIVLVAPEQADEPISGVFDAGNGLAFAEAVSAQLPLRSDARANLIVLAAR
jgi:transmembrane sensor